MRLTAFLTTSLTNDSLNVSRLHCFHTLSFFFIQSCNVISHVILFLGSFASAYRSLCDLYNQAPLEEVIWVSCCFLPASIFVLLCMCVFYFFVYPFCFVFVFVYC